jgi:hypothetical protein
MSGLWIFTATKSGRKKGDSRLVSQLFTHDRVNILSKFGAMRSKVINSSCEKPQQIRDVGL